MLMNAALSRCVEPPRLNPLLVRGHLPALDGLRGVAIILVLLFHATPSGPSSTVFGGLIKGIAGVGGVGVDLFFVLSGFLITGILLEAKTGERYFTTFYARRALRIFPLYYAVLLVAFLVIPGISSYQSADARRICGDQAWLWLYASNIKGGLSLLDRPFSAGWMQFDHFWSLAVEEQFYFFWLFLVLLFRVRSMLIICILLMVGPLILRTVLFMRNDPTAAYYSLTPCRIDQLAMGGLLAIMARAPVSASTLLKSALVILLITGAALATIWNSDLRSMVVGTTLLALFFAALLVAVVASAPRSPVRWIASTRVLRTFGRYSYAIYVLHPFILVGLSEYLSYQRLGVIVHSGALGVILYLSIAFAICLTAGWLSWHLYEKHFLKLKRFPYRNGAGERRIGERH